MFPLLLGSCLYFMCYWQNIWMFGPQPHFPHKPCGFYDVILHKALISKNRCQRRLLRAPWTARRWNQSILKEISPEYTLERLMMKLKLYYFGHLMWRANSLEKTLMREKIEGRRRRRRKRIRWLDGITDLMDMSLSKLWEIVKDREAWHAAVHGVTELDMSSEWTTTLLLATAKHLHVLCTLGEWASSNLIEHLTQMKEKQTHRNRPEVAKGEVGRGGMD